MKNWIIEYQIFSGVVGVIIMGIITLILNKKEKDECVTFQRKSYKTEKKVFRPGLLRKIFDRAFPYIHHKLTILGSLSMPPEYDILNEYLRNLSAYIENDIKMKTYIPLQASKFSHINFFHDDKSEVPYVKPIHQTVRQIIGKSKGGDSSSAQIAAINRRNKIVRNIHKTLMRSKEPFILLGDPGTGKTLTLQQVVLSLANNEIRHIFPKVIIYVRLGEFCQNGKIETKDVINFIKRELPENIKEYIDDLELFERLVVIFDGMDEMCRERYNEHTEALSIFASSRRGRIKSLFSCRITDFSPKFIHQRLVLLPFNRSQIKAYLYKYLDDKYLIIDGQKWSIRKLSNYLSKNKLPIETKNPFVLWLLCFYLQNKKSWPKSRIELLDYYCQGNFERKQKSQLEREKPFPKMDQVFAEWCRFAYEITCKNEGTAIPVHSLIKDEYNEDTVFEMLRIGKICGMIEETRGDHEYRIRFEHHRLQEFFTARYIHNSKQKIDWLKKLDAPCWQETIINLTLMGSHFESIYALVESVDQLLQHVDEIYNDKTGINTNENSPVVEHDFEITLADRIELGVRIISQIRDNSNCILNELKKTIEKGLVFLLENGNPISQIKMMQACQKSFNIDVNALQKPLNSKIGWVRSHALLLIASEKKNNQTVSTDITTEMMYDFAHGLFLNRFILYFKSLITTKRIYYWWSFLTIFILSIFNIGFTIFTSYFIYFFVKYVSDIHFFHHHYFLWSYTAIILSVVTIGIKREENLVWAIAPVTGSIVLLIIIAINLTWTYGSFVLLTLFSFMVVGVPVLVVALGFVVPIYGFMTVLFHFITITLASLLTGFLRKPVRSFFSGAWQNCNYEICFFNNLTLIFASTSIVVSFIIFINVACKQLIDSYPILLTMTIKKIEPFLSYLMLITKKIEPFLYIYHKHKMEIKIVTFVIFLILIYLQHMNLSKKKFSTIYIVLKCVGFILGFILTALILGLIFVGLIKFNYIAGKIISFALGFLFTSLIIYLFFKYILKPITWSRKVYPLGRFSSEDWIKSFKQSNSNEQHKLLLRSNHESLSLSAGEFINILKQIEDDVLEDPSASSYWELRYQLELILKQEKY